MLGTALIPLVLLAVATQLEPSSNGLGTHQQLGLPPCSFRMMFGIRCPGCGMTTSWAHFVRGQWQASMVANPGGFLLAFVGVASSGLFAAASATGRLPGLKAQRWMTVTLVAIATITLLDWAARLAPW